MFDEKMPNGISVHIDRGHMNASLERVRDHKLWLSCWSIVPVSIWCCYVAKFLNGVCIHYSYCYFAEYLHNEYGKHSIGTSSFHGWSNLLRKHVIHMLFRLFNFVWEKDQFSKLVLVFAPSQGGLATQANSLPLWHTQTRTCIYVCIYVRMYSCAETKRRIRAN